MSIDRDNYYDALERLYEDEQELADCVSRAKMDHGSKTWELKRHLLEEPEVAARVLTLNKAALRRELRRRK